MKTQLIGNWGESRACEFLQAQGVKIITRNFHAKVGEIDIIAEDNGCLIFIEVRVRSNPNHVSAVQSINTAKQRKILRSAEFYLQKTGHQGPCRIDVIAIDSSVDPIKIEWIHNAISY